jgi:hypothetical protein
MFFIRVAFWLGVVVLLLPTDEQQQGRLYRTATTAVERATTFCDRNAKTCATAADAWSTFLKKAEFGARLAGDLLGAGKRQDADGPHPVSADGKADQRGTLSRTDLQPTWRGPGRRTGA